MDYYNDSPQFVIVATWRQLVKIGLIPFNKPDFLKEVYTFLHTWVLVSVRLVEAENLDWRFSFYLARNFKIYSYNLNMYVIACSFLATFLSMWF